MRVRSSWTIGIATALALGTAPMATADTTDRPGFKVQGMVVVWASDVKGATPILSDVIIDTGTGNRAATSGDTDLIAGDVHTVVTGSLVRFDSQLVVGQGRALAGAAGCWRRLHHGL